MTISRATRLLSVIAVGLGVTGAAAAQTGTTPSSQPAGPSGSHIYRVSVFRAAPGQLRNLEKLLTATPAPGGDAGDFAVVFRHRQGHEWDFMTVEHMGTQATIKVGPGAPAPTADTPLSQAVAWHGDTYAAGPPLEEFRRALNLQAAPQAGTGGSAVYAISDYMAATGHRGGLRQVADQIAADTPGRSVILTHVEGAPWNLLLITRYDSWRQFAEEEEQATAQDAKASTRARGLDLREHLAVHHDTLAVVQAVVTGGPR
jgi:hypothetical protein